MTKQIAIIDPYVKSPAIPCFNRLVKLLNRPATYHTPSQVGLETLLDSKNSSIAYIVLGSASHIHEKLPWHLPIAEFLIHELKNGKPVLGCCFGHQLICHALGAEVSYFSQDEAKILGIRKIKMNRPLGLIHQNEELNLGVTHKQVVKNLPNDLLPIGIGLENDIVIHKTLPFLGTQAHPESSLSFCKNDIKELTNEEIELAQRDGAKLIDSFMLHFGI